MPLTPEATEGDTEWFVHDRFGLFLHWGLYALPARSSGPPNGRPAEWIKHHEELTDEEYERYFDHFDPDLYDPHMWAAEARNAGMRYFVVTTKHHDGFCLWDSDLTTYKAPNTPAGRDLLAPMVEAFREHGLKVGFYHSLIDWRHPEFPVDGIHPQRHDPAFRERESGRDIGKYREYLHGQVRELLTRHGKVDIMWFDFSYSDPSVFREGFWADGLPGKGAEDWQSDSLLKSVRELQPGILVNDRLEIPGDFTTPEQYQPFEWMKVNGKPVLWEACQTFSGSWGYDRDNHDWKSVEMLLAMLIDTVSKGGNLLLNVGPDARGSIEPRAVDRLRGIGEWMRLHSRSIYGCTASDFTPPPDSRYTQNGNRLYLHLLHWPYGHAHLPGLAGRVEYAQLLNDGSEIRTLTIEPDQEARNTTMAGMPPGTLSLRLPTVKPPVTIPVVELFLK